MSRDVMLSGGGSEGERWGRTRIEEGKKESEKRCREGRVTNGSERGSSIADDNNNSNTSERDFEKANNGNDWWRRHCCCCCCCCCWNRSQL